MLLLTTLSACTDAPPRRAATSCDPNPGAGDRTLCPPDWLGPLRATTDRTALDTLFAVELMRDTMIDVGEGMFEPGTRINIGQPDSARVVWTDSTKVRIGSVQALGPAWRTPEGLGAGSTLDEIERVLGPVEVLGFGWDNGGTVMLGGTRLADSGLFFRTATTVDDARGRAAYGRVRGDRPYASSSADVRALGLVVRRVDVRWPR